MVCVDFNEVKLLIEEFFNGKFEVKKYLGEASFAKVYLVNHNYLDTLMAMKIIKEPLSQTTNKKEVFREVTLACQLRHENIISIYDAAEITNLGDGKNHAYFVMEYVSGGDLESFLNSFIENNIFISIKRCLNLIKQILNGLNTLHSASPPIVHRDLKPNNVLLSFNDDGDIIIKISDFGFAKEVTTGISDIDIAGTRPYMAPELFNKSVSTKSDIYAVGVMFYQLLTNHYPYEVDKYSVEDFIDLKPWENTLMPPSYYNNNVSDDLDNIVMKCLEINPDNRYYDAGHLLADVEKAMDNYNSTQISRNENINNDYFDDYSDYPINDSLKEAFDLAKCENKLNDAIEILEMQILRDYEIRKYYSQTLRIWKSKWPDLKLISKAFTINLKGKNYKVSCDYLKEAIAYNPSIRNEYQHYIELWEIFIDLECHGNLFKAINSLEELMNFSVEIKEIYKSIIPTLKTYSVDEIVVEAIRLVNSNNLIDAANLMEFAVVCNSKIREEYSYRLSLWKQNMKMHFRYPSEIKKDTIDYAIDLGTTDSLISYFNNANPIIIKNHKTGDVFTPSAVLIDEEDNVEVGSSARNAILENNENAVSGFKRNMGFSIPFNFKDSSYSLLPEELSAEVLKDLRVSVFEQFGVNIEHAVICVPANSNPIKTKAVNDASELAGFKSHSLILEPIAVSLAYNLKKDNGIWMIYDLGGGTFNVTLIHDNGGEIEKLSTDGFENLGGNAFDWKIVNDLFKPKIVHELNLSNFRRENSKYVKTFAKLKNAAENAKKDLTTLTKTDVFISNLFDGYDFRYTLTRDELKKTIKPLITYTLKLSRNLLNVNSLTDEDIEKIILVGGSSLSPIVQESIRNEFNIKIESTINPLTVVAEGAAIYAGSIEKPNVEVKKESFSVILNHSGNGFKGKVFCQDSKFSFLGYHIEFKNKDHVIEAPLNIDGDFRTVLPKGHYDINLYNKNVKVDLCDKSPKTIDCEKMFIPYLDKSLEINNSDIGLNKLFNKYAELTNDINYLSDYSYSFDSEILEYIGRLVKISQKNPIALNLAQIYINYLEKIVNASKNDLEFHNLLENVLNKIEIVKNNNLFDMEDIDDMSNWNSNKLKEFHSNLIERYVALNKNDVIEECFFNLKVYGIFTNKKLAGDLIEKANLLLSNNNYEELFKIVNQLYELDERHN